MLQTADCLFKIVFITELLAELLENTVVQVIIQHRIIVLGLQTEIDNLDNHNAHILIALIQGSRTA